MKKIIVALLASFLLFGCGTSKATKTCVVEEAGLKTEIVAEAKSADAAVEKVTFRVDASYEVLGFDLEIMEKQAEALGITLDEIAEGVQESFLAGMGLDEDSGVKVVKNGFGKEGYQLEVTMDINEIKEVIEIEDESELTLNSFVTSFEQSGFTCK